MKAIHRLDSQICGIQIIGDGYLGASYARTIVGLFFFNVGIINIFIQIITYLVKAFTPYVASAVAANRTAMSIVGTFLPLAGAPLYDALDYGAGNTVLAVIALVMTPLPVIFYK